MLLGRGVDYIATHPDMTCPTAYGFVPDCGALTAMLYTATGRQPSAILGKPEPLIAEMAMEQCHCTPEATVLVGDRLHTDIACGMNAGIDTILVLSGESTRADAERSEAKPTLILGSIADISPLLTLTVR